MNISSLPLQSKKRLSELLEDLTDILNRKDILIENASKEIDRMEKIIDMQNKLDSKGSEFTHIATPIDAKELQELVEKSDKLSLEKEEINLKSKQLGDDLEDLVNIENSLMDEINNILTSTSLSEENDKGLYVDSINSNVYIIDAALPEEKELISREKCEIINCNINLIAEISKLYNSNINKIVMESNDNDFDKLKQLVEQYKTNKNNSYDKQLEILNKSFGQENNEQKEEIIEDNSNVDKVILDSVVEQPKEVIPETIETKPEEVIVPLSDIVNNNPEQSNNVLVDNLPIPESINQLNNVIYVDSSDKVVPNQIARATKDKLNNKIIPIFSDSFPKTVIERISSVNENEQNSVFNIDNFVTNKAA